VTIDYSGLLVAALGLALGLLSGAATAALIGASLLTVLLFPAAALFLRPWTPAGDTAPEERPATTTV
jgi:hypothetical protein